jgi:hypothetical protein
MRIVTICALLFCIGGVVSHSRAQLPSGDTLESAVRNVAGGGKKVRQVVSENSVYLRWMNKSGSIEVYIDRYESRRKARERFTSISALIDESLDGRGQKDPVEDVGENAILWTRIGFVGESTINFVRGNVRVAINGSSVNQVIALAQSIDKLLLE